MQALRVCAVLLAGVLAGAMNRGAQAADFFTAINDPARLTRLIYPPSMRPPELVPHKVVFHYGLSSMLTGFSKDGRTMGYRHMLVLMVPADISRADETAIRRIASQVMNPVTVTMRTAIDAQPLIGSQRYDPADARTKTDQAIMASVGATNAQFLQASRTLDEKVRPLVPQLTGKVMLGIATMPCDAPTCTLGEIALQPTNRSFARFAKIQEWMRAKSLNGINQPYVLNPGSVKSGPITIASAGPATFYTSTALLDPGYAWQKQLPPEIGRIGFANAVEHVRAQHGKLSYMAAYLAALTTELAPHVADAFDAPIAAARGLKSDPTVMLAGVSDEIARTRIRECVRLRGAFDPASASDCAGVKLNGILLAKCMAGQVCMPAFNDKINPGVALLKAGASLESAATAGALPRISLGKIDDLRAIAGKCASQNQSDAAAAYCVVKSRLAGGAASQLACLESARGTGRAGAENCALSLLPADVKAQLECMRANQGDAKKQAYCMGLAALPPVAQKIVMCGATGRDLASVDMVACGVSAATGSREAACVVQHHGNWEQAVACVSGNALPPAVQAGVQCAQKSPDPTGFGACMVASQAIGDAQRVAACYVAGHGSPAATAVCLAAPNLTNDQRIALECAAQTNGEVHAFALCTGGRLAAKELANCRGRHFAQGDCFGPNNELRKLANKFGTDIGPNSVAAQVADMQLQIAELQYGPLIDTIPKVAQLYNSLPDLVKPSPSTAVFGPAAPAAKALCEKVQCNPLGIHVDAGPIHF